jgi:alkylhydroperoxidase family enzyme
MAKLSPEEVALNRKGGSSDPKAEAAVHFAKRVAETRGKVSDADLEALRAAGYADAQIVEIVAVTAESLFTNFLNNVAQTDVDFPAVA